MRVLTADVYVTSSPIVATSATMTMLFVLLCFAVAAAAAVEACTTMHSLTTCAFLNGRCVSYAGTPTESLALGIDQHVVDSGNTTALALALDVRIGVALRSNDKQPGASCTDEAAYFLCMHYLRTPNKSFRSCRQTCAAYVTHCNDGRNIGWPLRYAPCNDYATPCTCRRTISEIVDGRCLQ